MPGVIMDNGTTNGSHTSNDRDIQVNGINGAGFTPDQMPDKGKVLMEQVSGIEAVPQDMLNQLPPEIFHITQGYFPLSRFLTRHAQMSFNNLSDKIVELSKMPMPTSAVNGNSAHFAGGAEDNSVDNVNKKLALLNFAQETHASWVKALVLTQWSRRAEDVSKMIDLKVHLTNHRIIYGDAVRAMMEVKRGLVQARLPNPDLKMALEVLSTGKVSWKPEVR